MPPPPSASVRNAHRVSSPSPPCRLLRPPMLESRRQATSSAPEHRHPCLALVFPSAPSASSSACARRPPIHRCLATSWLQSHPSLSSGSCQRLRHHPQSHRGLDAARSPRDAPHPPPCVRTAWPHSQLHVPPWPLGWGRGRRRDPKWTAPMRSVCTPGASESWRNASVCGSATRRDPVWCRRMTATKMTDCARPRRFVFASSLLVESCCCVIAKVDVNVDVDVDEGAL
mmetsp:Transcript_3578/g.9481  ORF Transcript_3578/g.9481 Transcript_3578/m.9481 type:complete len:228 (+) Transcript_3578:1480-2163(+)